MHLIPISSITVGERQRKEFKPEDLASLADSISRLGLIHPIILDETYNLVAGERRLRACRDNLSWTEIPADFTEKAGGPRSSLGPKCIFPSMGAEGARKI